jgi:putative endonuclease
VATQTVRRRHGNRAEEIVARHLSGLGWTVLGVQVKVGRDEVDLVAVDPGPPRELVAVEVRSSSTSLFGAPEERVDGAKVRRTYRAAMALRVAGALPDATRLPRLRWRVDLVLVELRPHLARDVGGPVLRHLRGVRPD